MEMESPSKLKLVGSGFYSYKGRLKGCLLVIVMLLLLAFGIYLAFHIGKDRIFAGQSYFTVVMDCGSTGTRVNVYEWLSRGVNELRLPVLVKSYPESSMKSQLKKGSCEYHCMQTEPGLDKFAGNASGVQAMLEPLMKWAKHWVPIEKHRETPIFVLATAGMRRLGNEDVGKVLHDVEAVLKGHEFLHKRSWIRVLSGKDEAYYAWVALNYQMGRLDNSLDLSTLGLLDLGGSSLQVAVEVDQWIDGRFSVKSKLGLIEHEVLAYSQPSFGMNAAFERSIAMLVDGRALRVGHPCLNSIYEQNYTCYDCVGSYDANKQPSSRAMQKTEVVYIRVVGDPNWQECVKLASSVATNSSKIIFPKDSSDKNVESSSNSGNDALEVLSVASPNTSFHALSGFFAIHSKLQQSGEANFTDVLEKGRQLCSRLWKNSRFASESGNYDERFCFQVPYIASLIRNALSLQNMNRTVTFGPQDVSWTLGAALVEGDFIWHKPTKVPALHGFFSPTLLIFILLICLGFFVYHCQVKLPMLGKKRIIVGHTLPSYVRRQHN